MERKTNKSLNFLKGIACFGVVLLHVPFPGVVGKLLYGFARFAVPFFFMISGYYAYDDSFDSIKHKMPKKIRHITGYLLFAEIIYLIWHSTERYYLDGIYGLIEWIEEAVTFQNFIRLLAFQTTIIGDVSWFLLALILCYSSVYIVAKYKLWKQITYLSWLLILCNVFIGEILPFFDCTIEWWYNSNFWVLGLPFFYIGASIKRNDSKLSDKNVLLMLLGGMAMVLLERMFTSASQFFLGNYFMSYALFNFAVKYPENLTGSILGTIGEKYAFGVYILHPIVRDIFKYIFPQTALLLWIRPVLVFVVSILIYVPIYRFIFIRQKQT